MGIFRCTVTEKIYYFVKCVTIIPKSLGFHNETHMFVNAVDVHKAMHFLFFKHKLDEMLLIYSNALTLDHIFAHLSVFYYRYTKQACS